MAYALKLGPDGLSVRTSDGLRELTAVRGVREAAFTEDGRALRVAYAAGPSRELPFRAFSALDDLETAARLLDSERSIRVTISSDGQGLNTRVAYATFQGRKRPVSEAELLALSKLHGPPPVWVVEIPELDLLAERLGPLWADVGGPRFALSRLDGVWTIQWWPKGGGLESRESLRDALAAVP